jgi:hypothetical protein
LSTASGHSSRSSTDRCARRRRTKANGTNDAKPPNASAMTGTRDVPSTRTPTTTPRLTLAAIN